MQSLDAGGAASYMGWSGVIGCARRGSIRFGEWVQRDDGAWALRMPTGW
jgi:hypothetical protein